MKTTPAALTGAAAFLGLALTGPAAWGQIDSFRPVTTFLVPDGGAAEIVSSTPDGNTLVYSNSISRSVGIVDLTDPRLPVQIAEIPVPGEPTSVAVTPDGAAALVVVNASTRVEGERPLIRPGLLQAYSLPDGGLLGEVRIGSGPDSIAVAELDGETVAVIAIENEPIVVDERRNLTDEDAPGQPGDISKRGFVQVIRIDWRRIRNSHVKDVYLPNRRQLARRGLDFSDDPQPEFVDIRGDKVAVTLQENNGVAILDLGRLERPRFITIFSTGYASTRAADLVEDEVIDLSDTYPDDVADEDFAGARVPDAIAWNAAGTALFTANEGELDFTGGRGFSAWSPRGRLLWDDEGAVEALAVTRGQYPEDRSENKGVEIEGVETGVFGAKEFAFVSSERGSFIVVYEISNPRSPEFVQLLPTGVAPEGLLALPQRGLFVTADEGDDGFGSISVFEGVAGEWTPEPTRPTLRSDGVDQPFAALSGLAADPVDPSLLYAVPDDALRSVIYTIEVGGPIARIATLAPVTIGGEQAMYDLEGIVVDTTISAPEEDAGFWLASEGNAEFGTEDYLPNLLIQVDAQGHVIAEVPLPGAIDPAGLEAEPEETTGLVRSNGFEGVTITADGSALVAAIQRGFQGESAVNDVLHTRIARYDLATESWEFFLYPLDPTPAGASWVALSEIVQLGDDTFAVIERDNNFGAFAAVKRIYSFRLDDVLPFEGVLTPDSDLTDRIISKTLLADVRDDFVPFEKVEGLALTSSSDLWAVLDNDGGSFENRFVHIGHLSGE